MSSQLRSHYRSDVKEYDVRSRSVIRASSMPFLLSKSAYNYFYSSLYTFPGLGLAEYSEHGITHGTTAYLLWCFKSAALTPFQYLFLFFRFYYFTLLLEFRIRRSPSLSFISHLQHMSITNHFLSVTLVFLKVK